MDYQQTEGENRRYHIGSAAPYQDDYTGFTGKGIHSSTYNCFIENTGHLSFVGAPTFSNNFVSPAFQAHSYYTGISFQSKKLTLNLVFYQLSLKELNKALAGLNPVDNGELILDASPLGKYVAKLSSIDVIEKYIGGKERDTTIYYESSARNRQYFVDLYICKVSVSFETIFNYEALSRYTLNANLDAINGLNESSGTVNSAIIPVIRSTDVIDNYVSTSDNTCVNNLYISNEYSYNDENVMHTELPISIDTSEQIVTLYNNSSMDIPFRIEFYNIHNSFSVIDEGTDEKAIIAFSQLAELEPSQALNITYSSETGSITAAGRLLQELHGFRGAYLASYTTSASNQKIPAHGSRKLKITCTNSNAEDVDGNEIKSSYAIYFNGYEYVL